MKLEIKPSRGNYRIPTVTIAKAEKICKFTGLPRTKVLGLMTSFVPVIKDGSITNLKNGKKRVRLIGEKGAWDFEI